MYRSFRTERLLTHDEDGVFMIGVGIPARQDRFAQSKRSLCVDDVQGHCRSEVVLHALEIIEILVLLTQAHMLVHVDSDLDRNGRADRESRADGFPAALEASKAVFGEEEDAERGCDWRLGRVLRALIGSDASDKASPTERFVSHVVKLGDAVEDPLRRIVAALPRSWFGDVLEL